MANEGNELEFVPIYDPEGWRAKYANALFPSNESLRWFLGNDGHQAYLMDKGLIFYRGRRLMTAEPRRLVFAVVDQLRAQSRRRNHGATY